MYGKKKSPTQKRSCYKMTPKSPILRALVGDQDKLPPAIQARIKAAPTKYMDEEKGKPRLQVKKKETKKTKVEVPRIGMKKKVIAPKKPPTRYMNKKTKSNKPCPGCSTICPSCRGKK